MIWEEEARGAYPEPSMLGLSGIDQLRMFQKRGGPIPPIAHLTGSRPTEYSMSGSTFTMPASPWWQTPAGAFSGGVLAIPADAALGTSIQSGLPAGTVYTTSEISMHFLRPASPESKEFIARGRLIHGGRSLGLSEASVTDAEGKLLAHATSRCFIFPTMEELPEPPEMEPWPAPEYDTPDPYLRDVVGEILTQDIWDSMSGLEILRAEMAGELPPPPIYNFIGLRVSEVDEGRCTFTLPATQWLTSPVGTVQGGFHLLLADAALAGAVQTTVPAGTSYATVDIKVNYLRPAYGDGRDLVGRGEVVHRGKSLAVARGEVLNADGKVICLSTGTTQILPGRDWNYQERVI